MSDLKNGYEDCIDDIISSFREISNFIGKSSENKSHVQRSNEIVNVTSTTIKLSQSEPEIVLQKLINSLSQLYNLSTSNKILKLVLKSLDKLIIFAKFVNINTNSISCILNLVKKIYIECNTDTELLKLIQIILSLSSPNSLLYHDNNLFQQSFNLICLIGKKLDSLKTNEIVTAALENLILQLVSIYRIKLDNVYEGNSVNRLFNENSDISFHQSDCEITIHSLLCDLTNLIRKKEVLFTELSIPTALDFISLIVNNISIGCIINDLNLNKMLIDIIYNVEYIIDDPKIISKYILVVNTIFKIPFNITLDFVEHVINLCNKYNDDKYIVLLLLCLLSVNHDGLKAQDKSTIQLLNYFTSKLYNMKYNVSDLSISSLDVIQTHEEINETCINISKLFNDGKLESIDIYKYTCIICLQGIISIILKYHRESINIYNSKQIFHIFISSEQPTKLVYSSINIIFSISNDKQHIMEFVCNRALYDMVSIYPLDCVHNIFKQIDLSNKHLLEVPIRTLIRIIYNIVENFNGNPTIEILHNLIDKSHVGVIINQFIITLETHISRSHVIKILHECLKSNIFKKKFGLEIYLYFVKIGSLDEIIESLELLGIKDDKIYRYTTSKYIDEINNKIESTSTRLFDTEDWEKLSKLHFSPDVIDIITKCLDEKLDFFDINDWHYIIFVLAKSTSTAYENGRGCNNMVQLLEQILDNGDFDINSTSDNLFECIGNCCKKFCKNTESYSNNMDNEGFILVSIIWKIADLIGKDGITNNDHWWHVLQSLIQLSLESSVAIKICSMRSLSITVVTYWKLFQPLLPLFFNEWQKVIDFIKDNDEIVDQESLFDMFVHETLQVLKVVEFDGKHIVLSQFIDNIVSKSNIDILIDTIKYLDNHTENKIYNQTIEHFIKKSIDYVNGTINSYSCTKISDASLNILKSHNLNSDNVIIVSLIYIVTINNRELKNDNIIKSKVNETDYFALWFGHLENLVASIKSDITFSKSEKMNQTLSNLNYHDASKFIMSNYNSVLNAVSLSMLDKILSNSNIYEIECQDNIRDFVYSICSLTSYITIACFDKILDIILQCFSSCSSIFIERLVHIMQQMVCKEDINWINLIPLFVKLIKHGLFRIDLHLFYIDMISQVTRCLIFTKQQFSDELLLCIYSISSKTPEFTNEAVILHLVLINLLEMALTSNDFSESNKTNQLLYEILDVYADNVNIDYNVILRLFNDSQDPNPKYSAFVTLVSRIRKSLTEGNIVSIYSILPLVLKHKISQPTQIGLTDPVFEMFKPHCLIPCILTHLKSANQLQHDNTLKDVYFAAVDLAVDKLTSSLNLNNIAHQF